MAQSALTTLLDRAKAEFLSEIEAHREELLGAEDGERLSAVSDLIGEAIDQCLDERSDNSQTTLLLYCFEDLDLFTREPDALSCITESNSHGKVTAQHCVYHNLYDLLHHTLEDEFDAWYQEQVVLSWTTAQPAGRDAEGGELAREGAPDHPMHAPLAGHRDYAFPTRSLRIAFQVCSYPPPSADFFVCFQKKENERMFPWNDELQRIYATHFPGSEETLVDFGLVPDDVETREDWGAGVTHFIQVLTSRGYQFQVAMYDGSSGVCPFYTVRVNKKDSNGWVPVDLPSFEQVVKQFCLPGQTTEIRERVLGIRPLPDLDLVDFLAQLP